ncbi:MAG: Bcr/CflA family efflux MFS transporter [Lautropia sp.]|nr:Bcr/CflA family efflux MFS transporter [Lautropia sp.]
MKPERVVLILALLLGLQPVTTDLYLAGLPALTAELRGSPNQAQLTLSGLLLSFGLAQLLFGPLSDRFGRKPVLMTGLLIYAVAAVGSWQAWSMESLLFWRILQGAALGAAVVCARALVRDLYAPEFGARILSKGLSGLGVIACLSLPAGGLLAHWFGWRAGLLAVTLFGLGTLVVVARGFSETLARPDPAALRPARLLRTWRIVLSHPRFWAFALVAACTYGGLFTFLATSSFVFIELLGASRLVYGLMMFSMAFAYLLGTYLCRALLRRFSLSNTVALGGVFSVVGGSLIGGLSLAGIESVAAILLPVWVFMLGHGILQPCGQAGAVGPFPEAAGAASALSGCLMMVLAFGMGQWLGWRADGTALPMTMGIWFWGVMTALVAWGLVRPQAERQAQ